MNRQESEKKVEVLCHGIDRNPFKCRVTHAEVAGEFCFPPLASLITGGARSVMTNAKPHIAKRVVFTLDVKDFFPSVGPRTVNTIFRVLGFDAQALDVLVDITTWDNQLPQGAPTSVAIANLAMYRVDVRLSRLARQHGFAYTRYVDDLTLSGSWRLLDFRRLTQRIVEEEGFRVNAAKIKTMPAGTRQLVTGIVVNEKLNLPKEKRDSIRGHVATIVSSSARSGVGVERVRGQLAWLSAVNPQQAVRLQRRIGLRKTQ
jgi:RNA-directed DNA polymerase